MGLKTVIFAIIIVSPLFSVTAIVTAERDLNDVVFQAYLFEAFPLDTISSPPANSVDMCETRLNVLCECAIQNCFKIFT